jgi:hypothetical protein
MPMFHAVTDESLVTHIQGARRRIAYLAPGVTRRVAEALVAAYESKSASVTVILDDNEDAYRIGFGDPEGLARLHRFASDRGITLRRQAGLRLGVLVADDVVTIWSPTPKAVETERAENEPNGIVLQGEVATVLDNAVGGTSATSAANAEIGQETLPSEVTARIVKKLQENPPAPFDLSQKTRVFSTKFKFVEFDVQGAEWTERRIKISSVLLNADLPENIQDLLETTIRPFGAGADFEIEVQAIVAGALAYTEDQQPILTKTRQADLSKAWKAITTKFLVNLKGYGWLIRQADIGKFRSAANDYEKVLKAWVDKFQERMKDAENTLVTDIARLIRQRITVPAERSLDYQLGGRSPEGFSTDACRPSTRAHRNQRCFLGIDARPGIY